ncbi:MAG: flagellar protein FlhE [Candidatus Accumulibacter sp.]|nr:flagellar protein FlhE [Accumulibacter sp.]
MKTRTLLVSAFLFLSALYAPLAAAQANPWSRTVTAPNIYSAGTDNSQFFSAPSSLLNSNTITNVAWNVGLYSNGATIQTIHVCYTPYYGGSAICENISNNRNGSSHIFDGYPAKGEYRITYNLTGGGTYPAYPSFSNTLTVTWQ